jgi:hypothetical protein
MLDIGMPTVYCWEVLGNIRILLVRVLALYITSMFQLFPVVETRLCFLHELLMSSTMFYPDEELGINIEVNAESPSHNEDNSLTPCSPLTNGERSEVRYSYTGPPTGYPVQNFPRGPGLRCHNCKTGEAMFYNIVHFIAYYLALTQLGFICLVKQSCVKKF